MTSLINWNKDKVLKFSINNAYIGEDLTDFPVLLNISESSGINGFDCSALFTELNYSITGDTFSGPDGSLPSTSLWSATDSTVSILNNKLYISSTVSKEVISNFFLAGDFDVQVDVEVIVGPSINSWNLALKVKWPNGANTDAVSIYNAFTGSTRQFVSDRFINNAGAVIATSVVTLNNTKLRITRSGTTFYFYYWNGSNWVAVSSYSGGSQNVYIYICRSSWDSNPSSTNTFSNFLINSGSVIWPSNKYPNRKKIAVVYPSLQEQSIQELDANTMLLIESNSSSNGSTTFIDSSNYKNTISLVGTTSHSISQALYGSSAIYFDGTGDSLVVTNNSNINLEANSFTLELFVYFNTIPGTGAYATLCTKRISSTSDMAYSIFYGGTEGLFFEFSSTGTSTTTVFTSTNTLSAGKWYHIAVCRNATELKLFIDGAQKGTTYTIGSTVIYNSTQPLRIGAENSLYCLNGFIDKFRLSKGIARYTSSFQSFNVPTASAFTTFTTGDPYWSSVVLAMPMNGTNGSTTFVDLTGKAITRYGDTRISTVQSKTGGASALFDGGNDYLELVHHTDFMFSSGDFTIEFWIYPMAGGGTFQYIVAKYGIVSNTRNWAIRISSTGTIDMLVSTSGTAAELTLTGPLAVLDTWQHVAVTRQVTTFRLFVNGVQEALGTLSGTLFSETNPVVIGNSGPGAEWWFSGYIDDLRITKGIAKYTVNFTLPTIGITTDVPDDPYWSSVVLAMPMNGTNASTAFIDLKGVPVNVAGNTQISTAQSKFGGSSAYFDGSGDYLSSPNNTLFDFGNLDLTIEFWIYCEVAWASQPASCGVIGHKFSDLTNGWVIYRNGSQTSKICCRFGSAIGDIYSNSAPSTSTWEHWAFVKSGDIYTWYKNGIADSTTINSTSANIYDSSATFYIGYSQTWSGYFKGYIDDVRITKGVARYTSNFTIPSSYYSKSTNFKSYLHKEQTQLYCEIECWDQNNKSIQLWAKVPKILYNQPTELLLYFDKTQPDNTYYIGNIGERAAQQVWDSNYSAVYHLSQDPSLGGACIKDSTINLRNGTPAGSMLSTSVVAGVGGKATLFNGTSQYIECGTFDPRVTYGTVTMEVTYALITIVATAYVFIKGNDNLTHSYGIGLPGPNSILALAYNNTYPPAWPSTSSRDTTQNFIYAAEVISGSNVTGYDSDNATAITAIPGTYSSTAAPIRIAATNRSSPYTYYCNCKVREARISQVARSTSWLKATNYSTRDALCIVSSGSIYTFSGYTTESGIAVQRTLYLYERASGELMDKCVSDEMGFYNLKTTSSGIHNIVCLDSTESPDYDDLILCKVTPTEVV